MKHLRLPVRATSLLACVAVVTAGLAVINSTPAQAAACLSRAHVYVTQPGHMYWSGYEDSQELGVPSIVVSQGELFRLGGNGINPGSRITWTALRLFVPGPTIDFFPSVPQHLSAPAHDNCVVHEEGPFPVTAPPGHYLIGAAYNSGNHPTLIYGVLVVRMEVLPGLPPPSSASQSTAEATSSTIGSMMAPGSPGGGGGGGGTDPDPCQIVLCAT